ncbi:hypothetical protein ACNF9X_07235 [Campylobacter jejuni]
MSNEIEKLYKELEETFPDDWGKGLNGLEIEIIDDATSIDELAIEDGYIEFKDKIMNINYKGNIVSIESPWEYGGFIEPKTFWYWEDLEKIGKILEIVSKHAKKIDFSEIEE